MKNTGDDGDGLFFISIFFDNNKGSFRAKNQTKPIITNLFGGGGHLCLGRASRLLHPVLPLLPLFACCLLHLQQPLLWGETNVTVKHC